MAEPVSIESIARENEALRAKLAEAENNLAEAHEVIRAIQSGDVDAVVVSGPEGQQVFTLRGAEYAYRALVEAMNEGAATLGTDGTVLYCNQRLADLLGTPLEQIIGSPSARLVAAEARNVFEAMLAQARSGEPCKAEVDFLARQSRIPAYVSIREMKSVEPPALCMVVTDLTEHKKRDELIAAGKLATSILESAAEAIAVCDETGHIIAGNEALHALCGCTALFQAFGTVLPLEIRSGDSEQAQPFSILPVLEGGELKSQEVSFRRSDGQQFWLLLTVGRMSGPTGFSGYVASLTNITERRQAQEALRESEKQFRTLANAIPQLCWMADAEGWIFWYNDRWYEYTGTTREQMEGWGWQSVHDPEALPKVMERWKASLETGEPFDMVFPLRSVAGEFHPFLTRVTPVKDAQGKIVRWFGTNTNISAQKQAEEELRKSQEWLRVTLTSIGDAVLAADVNGRVTFLNPAAAMLTGWTSEEAQGEPSGTVFRIINELTRVPGENIIEQVLREGRAVALSNHTSLLARDGREIPIEDSAAPIWDGSGNIVGVVLVFHDVTQKRRAVEALRESEARFRSVYEKAAVGIQQLANDGRILRANDAFCKMLGYSESELLGRNVTDLTHPDDRAQDATLREPVIRGERDWYEVEKRYLHRDGTSVWGHVTSSVVKDASGHPLYGVAVIQDVTERKLAQEALLRNEKLASVGRMASTIAHEINNPLETIGHAIYLAVTDPGTSAEAKSYLDIAVQELERVTHITRQTLAFHREDKTPKLIDLRENVDAVLKIFASRLKSRGISVEKRYAKVAPIRTAPGQVQQVISNLLSNGMDAIPNQGKIHFRISRSIGRNGSRWVRLTVADTGCGIPPERMKRIFEPFFTTKELVGTGLGLWVTKQIVEKNGATIRVRSKPEKGSVFSIVFPASEEGT